MKNPTITRLIKQYNPANNWLKFNKFLKMNNNFKDLVTDYQCREKKVVYKLILFYSLGDVVHVKQVHVPYFVLNTVYPNSCEPWYQFENVHFQDNNLMSKHAVVSFQEFFLFLECKIYYKFFSNSLEKLYSGRKDLKIPKNIKQVELCENSSSYCFNLLSKRFPVLAKV